jgi:hypothetical protein
MIQVVNMSKIKKLSPGDVYIGRYNARYGLVASPFANPFPITASQDRDVVLEKYDEYIRGRISREMPLKIHLISLADADRLVCWCAPLPCHGDILVKIMKELNFI